MPKSIQPAIATWFADPGEERSIFVDDCVWEGESAAAEPEHVAYDDEGEYS